MEIHRKTVATVSIWIVLVGLLTGCADHHYRATPQTVGELGNPLEALVALQQSAEKSAGTEPCIDQKKTTTFSISGTKIQIICSDGTQQLIRYREAPEAEALSGDFTCFGCVKLYGKEEAARSVVTTLYWWKFESAKAFATAWYVLAQPRKLQDPTTDGGFSDAVRQYRADPQKYAEPLRRVQVQVESAIKEHRTIEAATLYRDALKSAAGWPEGHFNLALLYGELEFYTEAINEMRRYLFLVPTAPDARAAQDKIYDWELKAK